ncbi:hypothetical protein MBLNU230_g2626t1 [Neophaeotheca triangularis]
MDLILTDATPADLPRLVEIELAAFAHETTNQVLSYRSPTDPAHYTRTLQNYRTALQTNPTTNHFRKILDPSTQTPIAWSKTTHSHLLPSENLSPTPSDPNTQHPTSPSPSPNPDPPMNRAWSALNSHHHHTTMQTRPHLYLSMLATLPSHQNLGAGTKLLEAIVAEADAKGLEVYLEATEVGRPLYEKFGFEKRGEIVFDPEEWEEGRGRGLRVERQVVMVRVPVGEKEGQEEGV